MAFSAKTRNVMTEDLGSGKFRDRDFDAPAMTHIRVYSNSTRPAAGLFRPGFRIWNTDDNAPNYSDGTNWRDAAGVIT